MLSQEEILRAQLTTYFESPAYGRKDEKRFSSLQVILRDLVAAIRGRKTAAYGLQVPEPASVNKITDCSTCPGKAAKTRHARTTCEDFALRWLRLSSGNTENKNAQPKEPAPQSKFEGLIKGKKPNTVYHNIQAFK